MCLIGRYGYVNKLVNLEHTSILSMIILDNFMCQLYERIALAERTCHVYIYIFLFLFVCVYTVYSVKICLLFYFSLFSLS